jgi:Bacterial Ig domain
MRLVRLVSSFFLLAVLSLGAANVSRSQSVDEYGGYTSLAVPGGASGSFRVGKIGSRWVVATPDGNAFWVRGVYAVNVDDHVDDRGSTYRTRVIAKYGDADLTWGPQQNRRLQAWGFNAVGEYSSGYTLPWATINDPRWPGGTQPVKLPAIPFPLQAAWYSQTNLFKYANGPVKEIYWVLDSHFTGYRGQFPDIFDPNFDLWVAGRVVSTEYAQAAASPWLLGVSSDDTDYLTGFGPGPDFDSGGHAHPHLGYVTLLTAPAQSSNPRLNVTYSDPKVYVKYALRDFLQARYGSIGALNSAWGATYTTFDSDGGWPNGRGLLDENGKGAWVGTDSTRLGNANATVRRDLDDFLYQIAARYFTVYRTQIKRYYPNVLYLGPTTIGGWGAPPRRQILQAAGQYLDVIRTSYNGDQARLDFMAQYAGDKPIMTWLGGVANPDSALFRYSNGGQSNMLLSQADRGVFYQNSISELLAATAGPTGAQPFIGIQWWQYTDNWAEKSNWGLVTLSDNAYDGQQATIAPGTDAWGYPTGGEERNYGDFLNVVTSANAQIPSLLDMVSSPPGTLSAAIISPTDGSTVTGTVSVAGAGSGTGSTVTRVDLLMDQALVVVNSAPNVTYNWDTTKTNNGNHSWYARAYDSLGNVATSTSVTVLVSNDTAPLAVAITQPNAGSVLARKSTVTILATVSGYVGTPTIKLYVNGNQLCSDSVAPYSCRWRVPAASGKPGASGKTYSLQAKVTDSRGVVAASAVVTVVAQ